MHQIDDCDTGRLAGQDNFHLPDIGAVMAKIGEQQNHPRIMARRKPRFQRYSRLPNRCSIMMNRLMKSR